MTLMFCNLYLIKRRYKEVSTVISTQERIYLKLVQVIKSSNNIHLGLQFEINI